MRDPERFLAGVRQASAFVEEAGQHEDAGTSHMQACHRLGRPQARVFDRMLELLPTDPDAREGFMAVMSEAIAHGCVNFTTPPYFGRLTVEAIFDPAFDYEATMPKPSNVLPFSRAKAC